MARQPDVIKPADARTLDGLFTARVQRSPDAAAYVKLRRGQWQLGAVNLEK